MSIIPAAVTRKPVPTDAPKALLQLSASRGKLALELAAPYTLGPLEVTQLIASLDGLHFPVDLSGGVARFRHRRGSLESIAVDTRLAELARFLEPKARNALGSPRLQLTLLPLDHGLTVGIHDDTLTLAFSALFAPDEDQPRFVIGNARCVGGGHHAHAVALRLARTLCGPNAERHGSIITFDRPLLRLVREALLDAGARLPSCHGVRFTWMETEDGVRLIADRSGGEGTPPPNVVRTLELARITQRADDALAEDRLDDARMAYLQALESAPRHPDIALRIAELDTLLEHSPETALASIVETMPAVDGGLVAARLLHALGDTEAATVAARLAAQDEPFAPLAAHTLASAASFATELSEQMAALDDAIARCPSCTSIRWHRVRTRLAFGLSNDAVADLGQLEAAARGSTARFEVCLQAGRVLMDARLHHDARVFFERALRCVPRSAQASVGLGRAFLATGDPHRGVALLSRAVTLLKNGDPESPAFVLELAQSLAEHARDLPAAIYHVRSIPYGLRETIAARALEGRWRNQLGDPVGASHAFAQAREAAAQLPRSTIANNVRWLLEAATFELEVAHDPRAAKRHAELALQAHPNEPQTLALFRRTALAEQNLTAPSAPDPGGPPLSAPVELPASPTEPPPAPATPDPFETLDLDAVDEQRIETLTDIIRGNPNDQDAVRELCTLLERAGRLLDLMALVSARLEETPDPTLRSDLTVVQKRTLAALITSCRLEGRPDEADMYEMVLESLAESSDPV